MAVYTLPATGAPWVEDFSYSALTFPDPIDQLQQYHDDFHVRFGGIRKPRLGNRCEGAVGTEGGGEGWRVGVESKGGGSQW